MIAVTDNGFARVHDRIIDVQGVAAMPLSPTIAFDSRASRRFRFIVPFLVALGLAVASIVPSLVLG